MMWETEKRKKKRRRKGEKKRRKKHLSPFATREGVW